MNDQQIGRIVRALRHRAHLRQGDLADRVGVSQSTVSLLERGRIASMPTGSVRRILAGLDAELVLLAIWRGGDLARLTDAEHARLVALTMTWLGDHDWHVVPEVSFSIFGEGGSIDVVGWHAVSSTLRQPAGPIDGLVFVSDTDLVRGGRDRTVRKRVRVSSASVARPAEPGS